jgi:O-antigen ligase
MAKINIFTLLIIVAVFMSGFADAFRGFSAGLISLQGLLTILAAVLSWFLIIVKGKISKSVSTACLLVAFILVGAISLALNASTPSELIVGLQNLCVYGAFVGFLILSATECCRNPRLTQVIGNVFSQVFRMSAMLYGVSILIAGPGANVFMGPRPFALYIILGVAWYLSAFRYRQPKSLFWFLFIEVMIALSFSRMVAVISLMLFPVSQASFRNFKGLVQTMAALLVIVLLAWLAFTFVTPIRERFTSQGDNAKIAGITINTSGRSEFWAPVYESMLESPLFGKGPGSVAEVVLSVNNTTGGHPHNDYLRIFHDFGIFGSILWVLGYFGILVKTLRNWLKADEIGSSIAQLHLSALLALLAIALAMLTDNVIVYIFTMAPLGILVGLSLGSAKYASKHQKVYRSKKISDSFLIKT